MRSVSVRDLREHLAEHLDAVEAGERLLVTRRGSSVAEIVRTSEATPPNEVVAALQSGIATRPGDVDGLKRLLGDEPAGRPVDLVAQVLADRR